jgi:hypothetical protein
MGKDLVDRRKRLKAKGKYSGGTPDKGKDGKMKYKVKGKVEKIVKINVKQNLNKY